jgi:hypothetical protein
MFGDATCAAANLDATFVLQTVMTPSRVEIVPIGFAKGVKLIVGPWCGAVFVFVGAGGDGKERIAFGPGFPGDSVYIRVHVVPLTFRRV